MVDDLFAQVWKLCLNSQTRAAKYVTELLTESDIVNRDMNDAKRRVINNTGSKFMNITPSCPPTRSIVTRVIIMKAGELFSLSFLFHLMVWRLKEGGGVEHLATTVSVYVVRFKLRNILFVNVL